MQSGTSYHGLSPQQVLQSRAKHGANVLTPSPKESLWKRFFERLTGPFGHLIKGWRDGDSLIFVLEIAALLSMLISLAEFYGLFGLHNAAGYGVFFEPAGIIVAILLATGVAFYFELKADKEFDILNRVGDEESVIVIRSGHTQSIPKCEVVVGDIVVLDAGMEVAADGRLLEAVMLHIDDSSLTGEPEHVKDVNPDAFPDHAYPCNMVHRGTVVRQGHGIFEVTAVGDHTENGRIMQSLMGVVVLDDAEDDDLSVEQQRAVSMKRRSSINKGIRTPLDEQLDNMGAFVANISYSVAGAIIVAKLLLFFDWAPATLALLIPVVLFCWAIIRRFDKWSTLACTFATIVFFVVFIATVMLVKNMVHADIDDGSLLTYALNAIMIVVTLVVVSVPEGLPMAVNLSLAYSMRSMLKSNNLVRKLHACETMGAVTVICTDKTGTLTQNQMNVEDVTIAFDDNDKEALSYLYEGIATNTTARLDVDEQGEASPFGNPTEGALLLWLHSKGIDYETLRHTCQVELESPFTGENKYMLTVVHNAKGQCMAYLKGAPEIVYAHCSQYGSLNKESFERVMQEYQHRAMRILALAYREVQPGESPIADGRLADDGFVLQALVAIADPVRADVPAAVSECVNAGIRVMIVTGDNEGTAREIGRQIGIWDDATCGNDNIISGSEIALLDSKALQQRVQQLKIVSRARPLDKQRIVEALQRCNEVVAVTGDGTNDAPALNVAHVGLSMGSGTREAKEASDITIVDNSFSSIGRAVMWGRSLYKNIQRFLLFQLTVNVAACLIVLVGGFMGTQSPLTVTQMLWVNLIMDTFGAMALSTLPPSRRVMDEPPRRRGRMGESLWENIRSGVFIIDRDMAFNIFGVGIIFFVLHFVMLFIMENADIRQLSDLLHPTFAGHSNLSPYELTVFFCSFVMTHFWYMFCARAYQTSGSGLNLRHCRGFITIAIIIVLGQVLIVNVLSPFFDVIPLPLNDWVVLTIVTSLVLWIREIYHQAKLLRHRTTRQKEKESNNQQY